MVLSKSSTQTTLLTASIYALSTVTDTTSTE
jgi:hypothetical protein